MVVLTAAMMVVEIAAGWLTGSMALLTDGLHMATHAGALGVAALAYGFARRHAHNPRFTFGTGKFGDLAGFASALVLALVALGIGIESIGRLMSPASVAYSEALWIAALGLIVNIASAVLLDAAANPELEAEIREAIEDGDARITDLHVWRVGPGKYATVISLVAVDPLAPGDYVSRVKIHEELVHVTVEPHRCEGHHQPILRVA